LAVEKYSEIADALVVGQKYKDDERVILFLKMAEGQELTKHFIEKIKHDIRHSLSPRHVPALVLAINEIPVSLFSFCLSFIFLSTLLLFFIIIQYTINGKKVEVAVKKIISGETVVPSGAIANPTCLEHFKTITELYAN